MILLILNVNDNSILASQNQKINFIDKQYITQMSTVQKDDAKSQSSKKSGKLHSAIQKAQAIQQRQQLRTMIVDKFNKDFAKGNKNIGKLVEDIVTDYFGKEKITEESLRVLKQNVTKAVEQYKRDNKSQKSKQSTTSKQEIQQRNHQQKQQTSSKHGENRNNDERRSQAPSQKGNEKQSVKSGRSSQTSSVASKSVYQVEGDDDDEWATLVKFDTELFKKQKQLEKMREQQFKKKLKKELDKQMEEKKKRRVFEYKEQQEYFHLQEQQAKSYDHRQKEKKEQYQRKIQLQKQMRDKQVKDQNKRKKFQKRKEDELDHLLVQKIKEEITEEQRQMRDRKLKELNRFKQVMVQNQQNQKKIRDETQKQRDIRCMQEYARLQDQLQKKRQQQKKQREEKIKAVMASFADSVIKDQKEQIKAQDQKMMKHIQNQLRKQKQQEERRKKQSQQQKKQMRDYLARQVQQKRLKEIEEKKIDQKQAKVWHQDTNKFFDSEKQKQDYLKDIYKKHEQVLLAQIKDKDDFKNRKKMNTLELLYNKALMKAAADQSQNIKKAKV